MPKVYIAENAQPNAFATGRNPEHAAVCVTSGLLARVTSEELAGVLAHELSHVKNRDTLTMTITAVIAGAIVMLANFALFFRGGRRNPPGPRRPAAGDVAGAHRRDAGADGDQPLARIRGRPRRRGDFRPAVVAGRRACADRRARRMRSPIPADANPATAHMFIVNPLHGGNGRPVRQPSFDRGTHRAAAGHGGPIAGASLVPGRERQALAGARRAHRLVLVRRAAQAPAARCGARRPARSAAARCRICPRPGQRDAAPFRPARCGDPPFRAQAAAAAQGGPDAGNSARGRVRTCCS